MHTCKNLNGSACYDWPGTFSYFTFIWIISELFSDDAIVGQLESDVSCINVTCPPFNTTCVNSTFCGNDTAKGITNVCICLVRCMSTRILFLRLAFSLWYLSLLTFLETGRSRDHHSEQDVDVWGIGHNSMQPRLLLTNIFWFPVSFSTFLVSSHVPGCNWISFMFCSSMSVPQHLMRNNICQILCVSILQSFLFRISSPGNYI